MFIYPAILDQFQSSNLFTPLEDTTNYCPLDANNLYEVIYIVTPLEDTTNYCPLDANDLYIIL